MHRIARSLLILAAGAVGSATVSQAQAPSPKAEPFVVEYYYKVRWGYADEFWRLFKKNHLPILMKEIELGAMTSVTAVAPQHHGTEDGRWDYRVTITFPSFQHSGAPSPITDEIRRKMYPDQELFQKEEQRRFELLAAHWDLPVVPAKL